MIRLDGLHKRRNLGRNEIESLALGHGEGARIWTRSHHNRDTDDIEMRHIGQTRNAHYWRIAKDALQRFRGLCDSMRSSMVLFLGAFAPAPVSSPQPHHLLLLSPLH